MPSTHFKKERFALNFMTPYVDIDQGIYKVKLKVALNEKRKKLHGFSFSINMANSGGSKSWAQTFLFWSVSSILVKLEKGVNLKKLKLLWHKDHCYTKHFYYLLRCTVWNIHEYKYCLSSWHTLNFLQIEFYILCSKYLCCIMFMYRR